MRCRAIPRRGFCGRGRLLPSGANARSGSPVPPVIILPELLRRKSARTEIARRIPGRCPSMRRGAQPSAKRESPHERQKRHGSLPCLFRHRVRGTPKAAYGPHLHSPAESVPYRALSPPHTAAGQCLRPAAVPFRRQRMSQQKPINSPAKPTARITTARGPARSVRQKVTVPVWLSSSRYWPSNRASVLVQPSSLSTQRSYRLPGSGRRQWTV